MPIPSAAYCNNTDYGSSTCCYDPLLLSSVRIATLAICKPHGRLHSNFCTTNNFKHIHMASDTGTDTAN